MYNSLNNPLTESALTQVNKEYQIYTLLTVALISLQLICNTIEPVVLQISLFKIPMSAIFYVISFAICDVVTENFGFKLAVRITVLNVISQLIYCGIAATIFLVPEQFHTMQSEEYFHTLFRFLSVELLSSIASLLIAMIANDYIINKLKLVFLGKGFWWRTIVSTLIGEIIMLNIDYNIAFLGKQNLLEIQHMIFSAMTYKTLAAFLLALPATLLSRYISSRVFILKPNMHEKPVFFTDLKNALLFR